MKPQPFTPLIPPFGFRPPDSCPADCAVAADASEGSAPSGPGRFRVQAEPGDSGLCGWMPYWTSFAFMVMRETPSQRAAFA